MRGKPEDVRGSGSRKAIEGKARSSFDGFCWWRKLSGLWPRFPSCSWPEAQTDSSASKPQRRWINVSLFDVPQAAALEPLPPAALGVSHLLCWALCRHIWKWVESGPPRSSPVQAEGGRRRTSRLQEGHYGKSERDSSGEKALHKQSWLQGFKVNAVGTRGKDAQLCLGELEEISTERRMLELVLKDGCAVCSEHGDSTQWRWTGNGSGDKDSQLWNSFSVSKPLGPQLYSVT